MFDSVRPHRRTPGSTRLPRPWDSPGKNTGVGCHFLLQCMKVKIESEVAQSCLTLSDPVDCSLPGSSVQGIFQARVLEWGAIAFSGIYIHTYTNSLYLYTHTEKAMTTHSSTLAWESPMERAAWWAAVHGVAEGRTQLSDFTFTFHFHQF